MIIIGFYLVVCRQIFLSHLPINLKKKEMELIAQSAVNESANKELFKLFVIC